MELMQYPSRRYPTLPLAFLFGGVDSFGTRHDGLVDIDELVSERGDDVANGTPSTTARKAL
jgi:hypothetical protein